MESMESTVVYSKPGQAMRFLPKEGNGVLPPSATEKGWFLDETTIILDDNSITYYIIILLYFYMFVLLYYYIIILLLLYNYNINK